MDAARRLVIGALVLLLPSCVDGGDATDGELETGSSVMRDSVGITGSYRLVSRELPDGSVLEPPEIFGFMTYTPTHRHFHIYTPLPDGTPSSVSAVSEYSMSGGEYSEEPLYEALNNISGSAGLDYNIAGEGFSTPLSRTDQRVEFRDGGSGPILTFSGDSLVAELEGDFVDRWIRVE